LSKRVKFSISQNLWVSGDKSVNTRLCASTAQENPLTVTSPRVYNSLSKLKNTVLKIPWEEQKETLGSNLAIKFSMTLFQTCCFQGLCRPYETYILSLRLSRQ